MTKHFCDMCGKELDTDMFGVYHLHIGFRPVNSGKEVQDSGNAMLCAEDGAAIVAQMNIVMKRDEW